MKIVIDTEILSEVHPERLLNNAHLDSLGLEGFSHAGIGCLVLLANVMDPIEFKAFVQRSQWAFENYVPPDQFREMN